MESQRNFLIDLKLYFDFINEIKSQNEKEYEIIQNCIPSSELYDCRETMELLVYYKDILLNLIDKNSLEKMFFSVLLLPDSSIDVHSLVYYLKCMIRPLFKLQDNYFSELIDQTEANKKIFNFKEYFRFIFTSKCILSYYNEIEEWEELNKNYITEIKDTSTFERFYERLSFVPLPYFFNGLTDTTLMIFINSNDRKATFKSKLYLKHLVKLF